MSDVFDGFTKFADVFFNGRPANMESEKPSVNMPELIRKGTSHVFFNGKIYEITVKDVSDRVTRK